ncbi:MAG: hypothetical protein HYV28_07910 [Ignavibacteriales bacterium]|nr:hypothetical protein [Ignavibacteriales bacterium]
MEKFRYTNKHQLVIDFIAEGGVGIFSAYSVFPAGKKFTQPHLFPVAFYCFTGLKADAGYEKAPSNGAQFAWTRYCLMRFLRSLFLSAIHGAFSLPVPSFPAGKKFTQPHFFPVSFIASPA